jgi:hypothetical protein
VFIIDGQIERIRFDVYSFTNKSTKFTFGRKCDSCRGLNKLSTLAMPRPLIYTKPSFNFSQSEKQEKFSWQRGLSSDITSFLP